MCSVCDASDLAPDNIALPQGGNVVKMILVWCYCSTGLKSDQSKVLKCI